MACSVVNRLSLARLYVFRLVKQVAATAAVQKTTIIPASRMRT